MKKLLNVTTILILINIIIFSGCKNEKNDMKNVADANKINIVNIKPSEIPKGEITDMIQFTDKFGEHVVIAVKKEYRKNVDLYHDGNYRDLAFARFEILNYIVKDSILSKTWFVSDSIDGTDVDATAEVIKNTLQVTDLNNDGVAEVWFAYKIGQRSDMSPIPMKLIMYEGNKKYIIEGSTKLKCGTEIYGDGAYKLDKSFDNSDQRFISFALRLWKDNVLEKSH